MPKTKVKQALKIIQKQPDYFVEMLQEVENDELEYKLLIMAKKAYKAEMTKKTRNRHDNYYKANPNSNI